MKTINKSLISLALALAASGTTYAATDSSVTVKIVRADFKEKLLLIPCVEVKNSPFDGFWNVLMAISGGGTQDWKVIKADLAKEGECDSAPDTSSTDDLLKSMGMPSTAELIKNGAKDDAADDTNDQSSQNSSGAGSAIKTSVTDTVDNATKK